MKTLSSLCLKFNYLSPLSFEKSTMKPKKDTKVVHTKNTGNTKITNNGFVYASGGRATLFLLYKPPAAM